MKIVALVVLLSAPLFKPKQPINPADYNLSMHVVCSTASITVTGSGTRQRVGGLLNGKPVELQIWNPAVYLPLKPGDYKVKLLGPDPNVNGTSHDVNENYEFLLNDSTVRGYQLIGVGTTGCGDPEHQASAGF